MSYNLDDQLAKIASNFTPCDLDSEIVLAKALLSWRLASCKTDQERALFFPAAQAAIVNIERMVHDRQKFIERTSQMLEKSAVEQLGIEIIRIISQYIKPLPNSDELIEKIAADISEAISNAKNPEAE